ncbi:MAG TPA: hypothetical protein VE641_04900, partial [Chthoniobacterales bacterium]|nr:hypothetical protein [Chthoniobacterales bacterium]
RFVRSANPERETVSTNFRTGDRRTAIRHKPLILSVNRLNTANGTQGVTTIFARLMINLTAQRNGR